MTRRMFGYPKEGNSGERISRVPSRQVEGTSSVPGAVGKRLAGDARWGSRDTKFEPVKKIVGADGEASSGQPLLRTRMSGGEGDTL